MMNLLSAAPVADETAKIAFNPGKFIESLRYMGIGMLVIFAIIGMIILTTLVINKVFSD